MKLLRVVGMEKFAHKRTNKISGGQAQRAAIARGLVNVPSIVLADEPTGNLDRKNTEEIMEILQKLKTEDKKTIVMVTHDQTFSKYSDQTYFLKDGTIVLE